MQLNNKCILIKVIFILKIILKFVDTMLNSHV